MSRLLMLVLGAGMIFGCAPAKPALPTMAFATASLSPPTPSATLGVTQTAQPSQTVTFQPSLTPTEAPVLINCLASQDVCVLDWHFVMQRPIGQGGNSAVDPSYRYGGTQLGKREPHHGVEFPNAQGTPVLAVADGVVVFAGNDATQALAWTPAFYGNVVVIEHHFSGVLKPVYSLYAHQFKILTQVGQQVKAGDQIGEVGATGIAIGSHLHFEVREGVDDYHSNRNPELWLAPLPGTGVLAGRIQDSNGHLLAGEVNIQPIQNGVLNKISAAFGETYVTAESIPVQVDDELQENFAVGELAAGSYRLSLHMKGAIYEQVVELQPGRLTFVRFIIK